MTGFIDPANFWHMLAVAYLSTIVWRIVGIIFADRVPVDSTLFTVINGMAYAMIAGLMLRLILYPSGALADTHTIDRLLAFGIGVGLFIIRPKTPLLGVIAGFVIFSTLILSRLFLIE